MTVHTSEGCRRDTRAASSPARVTAPMGLSAFAVAGAAVLASLLLPGPIATVIALGVALVAAVVVRRTLASIAAGAGVRVAQAYRPGEQVRVFVPEYERTVEAEVVRVGLANTTLMTHTGLLVLPNNAMLRPYPPEQAAA